MRLRAFGRICNACRVVTVVDEDNVPYVRGTRLEDAKAIIRNTMDTFLQTYDVLEGQRRITDYLDLA